MYFEPHFPSGYGKGGINQREHLTSDNLQFSFGNEQQLLETFGVTVR